MPSIRSPSACNAWMRDPSKTPLSPPLSRYVLATCPCTSSSLAFSFPFPPKREDPEKRHTGNPVRHNCPKTLLMSRGRKLTNADPNLYIRSGISNLPCIFFDVVPSLAQAQKQDWRILLFSQTWQMVGDQLRGRRKEWAEGCVSVVRWERQAVCMCNARSCANDSHL